MARVKMGLKSLDDDGGWKRGACGIDGDARMKIDHKADYSHATGDFGQAAMSGVHHLDMDEASTRMKGSVLAEAPTHTWKPGSIKQGSSPPRFKPKGDAGLASPKAAQPTGKYKKKGGKGQRSGA